MSKEREKKAADEREELDEDADAEETEDSDDDASEGDESDASADNTDAADTGEEPDEDETAAAEAAAKEKRRKQGRSERSKAREVVNKPRRRLEKPVLPPETSINAPSRQTLGMIGAMALATLVMWGTAKTACNAHPAQTRKPRELATAELAKDPKAAALEMAQRWASYNFDGALELSMDKVEGEIRAAKDACAKDAACTTASKKEYTTALATAVLLGRDGAKATVRVTGLGGALEGKTTLYEVELAGPIWKVARTTDKAPAPPPVIVPPPAPTPPASAAPPPAVP
jgi:hypothetical protein